MKKYLVILLSAGFIFSQNAISYTTISLTNPKGDWVSFFNTLEATCNINTFIETGTYLGDTTALAAEVFPIIHTIELLPTFYEKAVERFQYNYNVTVHLGDSAKNISYTPADTCNSRKSGIVLARWPCYGLPI